MGIVKTFRISASLRTKGFELLSRYEPSDLAYTLGASLYDRSNKMLSTTPHSKEQGKELKRKKDCYMKAAKRFLAAAKALKMLEMQYLQ